MNKIKWTGSKIAKLIGIIIIPIIVYSFWNFYSKLPTISSFKDIMLFIVISMVTIIMAIVIGIYVKDILKPEKELK